MKTHLLLFFFFLLVSFTLCARQRPAAAEVKIGVVLNMNSSLGKTSFISMKMAVADFYAAHPGYATRIVLDARNSAGDVIGAAAAAVDLLENSQVQAIIGPQNSGEAAFVADIGTKTQVPIVSPFATSPALSPSRTPFFVRTAPSDAAQSPAIAALINAFGWRRLVPVYEDSDVSVGLIPSLVDALRSVGADVPYRASIPFSASRDRISAELYKLKTMQTRVFLVHTSMDLAHRLFAAAAAAGMMSEGYVWIMTDRLTSLLGLFNAYELLDEMQGVLGVEPFVPLSTPRLRDFRKRWRREFIGENPGAANFPDLSTFDVWAYDTVWAVAMAVEAAWPFDTTRVKPNEGRRNGTTDLAELGVSNSGKKLLDSILSVEFRGLGGNFQLSNGELNVTAFRILNVIGEMGTEIGFWTPTYGLLRRLDLNTTGSYSATMESLRRVIWPGEAREVPKGWEAPTSGKKLQIAVPGTVLPGFYAFLNVQQDSVTNQTVAGGFVIEVFEAALKKLPYAVPFEYVSYRSADGNSTGEYNQLVMEVYRQRFDAVVGDTTITSNRSRFVDFTLPYTVSGISMVVPLKNEQSKNAWIFLKPLTTDLWLVCGAFFVFTGLVVWVLEHRINPEFRGPPTNQIGTIFYFTFSSLVFAHKENIVSNLGRVVMVIWVFVVLILQSSYTASLTSMLTVQQFQPSYTDIKELKDNGEFVGHLKDSFVKGFLVQMGFNPKKLIGYRSPLEFAEGLAKGSDNGGVAAIVDEVPYLRVFLKDYCDNYTMAGQTYKTGGFGFVFPKGSPLVPDLSRAILNITEGDEMADIERRWFGDQANCQNQGSTLASSSLDFQSFWGLFLITGIASSLAFFAYWASFFYKNRHYFNGIGRESSLGRRLSSIAKLFDQKDLHAHTFRHAESKDGSNDGVGGGVMPTPSTFAAFHESPSSFSINTYDEGVHSIELATPNSETPLHGEIASAEG